MRQTKQKIIAYQNCYAASKLHKTSFIIQNKIKFPEDIKNSEDTIFWFLELYCNPQILLIDKPLYYYRKHEESLSSQSCEILDTLFEAFNKFSQYDEFKYTNKENQLITIDYFVRIATFIYSSINSWDLYIPYEEKIKKFLYLYKKYKNVNLYKFQGYRYIKFRKIFTIMKKLYFFSQILLQKLKKEVVK